MTCAPEEEQEASSSRKSRKSGYKHGSSTSCSNEELRDGGESGSKATKTKAETGDPRGGGGGGESLLEAFGISSWTPPWSTSKEQVQKQAQTQEGPPELEALRDRGGNDGSPGAANGDGEETLETAPLTHRGQQQHQGKLRDEASSGSVGQEAEGGGGAVAELAVVIGRGREGAKPGRVPPRLCVLDARTAVAALGNQLVGKGIETGAG